MYIIELNGEQEPLLGCALFLASVLSRSGIRIIRTMRAPENTVSTGSSVSMDSDQGTDTFRLTQNSAASALSIK